MLFIEKITKVGLRPQNKGQSKVLKKLAFLKPMPFSKSVDSIEGICSMGFIEIKKAALRQLLGNNLNVSKWSLQLLILKKLEPHLFFHNTTYYLYVKKRHFMF